ncbi:hypothetical protein QUB80_23345 [Chlorogloeopsis sp. ULAP01]|nr:hypothetical protein [Chlorogloeopsis sp. ULAP01]MDM9383624.1 hypothetical protein [Chlorogloeopsis sp. ULAP01]
MLLGVLVIMYAPRG